MVHNITAVNEPMNVDKTSIIRRVQSLEMKLMAELKYCKTEDDLMLVDDATSKGH